jgi:poly-gamma-glutamate synthesis protein (capsule biosynthesis protein)
MKRYVFLLLLIVLAIVFYPTTNGVHYFNLDQVLSREGVKILNFGDVMFDRGVRNIIENRGRDPFEYIKKDLEIIKDYDVKIVNLEGPIVTMDRALCQQKAYNFQFPPDTTDRLKSIGVNIVTIANNHSYDCMLDGYESTKKYLKNSGLEYIGEKEYEKSFVIKEIAGKKVAFVGMDETIQPIPLSGFYEVVRKLKIENDLVVVNIHWGTEYELRNNETQKLIAHQLIDNGADVIFGHHPHVVQNIEVYKGKAIFYSLGNFVFDQNFGDTTVGLGVGAEFKDDKATFTLFPFNVKIFAPDFMKGTEREAFCENFLKGILNKDCSFEIKI